MKNTLDNYRLHHDDEDVENGNSNEGGSGTSGPGTGG